MAVAAAAAFIGTGIASARHTPGPRPARSNEHGNTGTISPAGAGTIQAHQTGKAAADHSPQHAGRAKVVYVLFTDNHGTNCDDPTQPGLNDGAPVAPITKLVPLSLFVPVPGNTQGCEYLPFSTHAFPQDKNNPASAIYGYGLLPMTGTGNPNSGFIAQSSLPLGVPVAPEAPPDDLTDLNEAIRNLLSMLGAAEPVTAPAGQALEASVHDRDVRVAAKNVPQPSASRAKTPG
jgi:hypothetical protein